MRPKIHNQNSIFPDTIRTRESDEIHVLLIIVMSQAFFTRFRFNNLFLRVLLRVFQIRNNYI